MKKLKAMTGSKEWLSIVIIVLLAIITPSLQDETKHGVPKLLRQRRKVIQVESLLPTTKRHHQTRSMYEDIEDQKPVRKRVLDQGNDMFVDELFGSSKATTGSTKKDRLGGSIWTMDRYLEDLFDQSLSLSLSFSLSMPL